MPVIKIELFIEADIELVFDLSRSIDLHQISTNQTNERAIAGCTEGLIGLGESVTWEARHFGIRQQLTSKVTHMERPYVFVDEMQQGAFKYFKHEHRLEQKDHGINVTDIFDYAAPLGILGRIAEKLFLTRYMRNLLEKRNLVIKQYAENGEGAALLR